MPRVRIHTSKKAANQWHIAAERAQSAGQPRVRTLEPGVDPAAWSDIGFTVVGIQDVLALPRYLRLLERAARERSIHGTALHRQIVLALAENGHEPADKVTA